MRKKYTCVNILWCVNKLRCANQPVSKFKLRSHWLYHQEYFVCKFIISGLKPVHLSFLYLQNKKRLLRGVLAQKPARQKIIFVPPPPHKRFDNFMLENIQWANF